MEEYLIIYYDPEINKNVSRLGYGLSINEIINKYSNDDLPIVSIKKLTLIRGKEYGRASVG